MPERARKRDVARRRACPCRPRWPRACRGARASAAQERAARPCARIRSRRAANTFASCGNRRAARAPRRAARRAGPGGSARVDRVADQHAACPRGVPKRARDLAAHHLGVADHGAQPRRGEERALGGEQVAMVRVRARGQARQRAPARARAARATRRARRRRRGTRRSTRCARGTARGRSAAARARAHTARAKPQSRHRLPMWNGSSDDRRAVVVGPARASRCVSEAPAARSARDRVLHEALRAARRRRSGCARAPRAGRAAGRAPGRRAHELRQQLVDGGVHARRPASSVRHSLTLPPPQPSLPQGRQGCVARHDAMRHAPRAPLASRRSGRRAPPPACPWPRRCASARSPRRRRGARAPRAPPSRAGVSCPERSVDRHRRCLEDAADDRLLARVRRGGDHDAVAVAREPPQQLGVLRLGPRLEEPARGRMHLEESLGARGLRRRAARRRAPGPRRREPSRGASRPPRDRCPRRRSASRLVSTVWRGVRSRQRVAVREAPAPERRRRAPAPRDQRGRSACASHAPRQWSVRCTSSW